MERIRRILWIVLTLGLVLGFTVPVFADTYSYYIPIEIFEIEGTAKTGLPIIVDLSIQNLIDMGYLDSNGLDSRMKEGDTERPYMLVDSKLGFVLPSLGSFQGKEVRLYTDYSPVNTDFDVVVGPNGYITVPDDSSIELGDTFEVEIRGWVDTSAGSDKNLIYKASAFRLYISAEGSIKATFNPGGTEKSVTATSISSGLHTVKVYADGTTLKIYIDDVEEDSTALGGVSVTDNGNIWTLIQNDVMPYMEFLKILVGS